MFASWDTKPESWEETLLSRWAAMPPGGRGWCGRLLRLREEEDEVGEWGWDSLPPPPPPPLPKPILAPPPEEREALLWVLLTLLRGASGEEEERGRKRWAGDEGDVPRLGANSGGRDFNLICFFCRLVSRQMRVNHMRLGRGCVGGFWQNQDANTEVCKVITSRWRQFERRQ